jgi:hypothetical protein
MNTYPYGRRSPRRLSKTFIIFAGIIALVLIAFAIIFYVASRPPVMPVSPAQSLVQNLTINGHVTLVSGTTAIGIDDTLNGLPGVDRRVEIEEDCYSLQGTIWQQDQQVSSVEVRFTDSGKIVGHCLVLGSTASAIAWGSIDYQAAWNLYDSKSFSS